MNRLVALYTTLTSSTFETEGENRPVAFWSSALLVLILGIFAIVALISDLSFTADQRIQMFQQSGIYP